jgi:hypothetical protein
MKHEDKSASEFEPVYDLERGAALNERAGEHDPAFKKQMEERRAQAERVKKGRRDADR